MAPSHPQVRVNAHQCLRLASRIGAVRVCPDPYLRTPADETERQAEANYWFYVTAICQSTRTFEGTIRGDWVRGWDYLVRASRRHLEGFTAKRMQSFRADDLRRMLSDDGNPRSSPIDRVQERLEQLHDCATVLRQEYDGQAMKVYARSAGHLEGPGGLLDLLSQFSAYSDPLQKKSVLLAGMLHEVNIWPLNDPHNLKVAMDYHAMRVALRSGMVELSEPALAHDLRAQKPVSESANELIRSSVSAACDILVRESGLSVFAFDKWIWHLGRSCCFYEHEPVCGSERLSTPCFKRDTCTFIRATTYPCPHVCPLDGTCKGSRDSAYRSLWETNVYTPHY